MPDRTFSTPEACQDRWWGPGGLLLVVALAFALRLVGLRESLWLDELHTAWSVAAGWDQITARAQAGNYSPLYFYLLWPLAQGLALPQEAAWMLRLPSLLAGTALVATAGLLVRRWSGRWSWGILAAGLVAFDRHSLFFSQEARPYALVQWLSLLQLAVFLRVVNTGQGRARAAWVALTVFLFYLHYTSLLILAGEIAFWPFAQAGWLIRNKIPSSAVTATGSRTTGPAATEPCTYRLPAFLFDLLVIGLAMIPALPHLQEVTTRRHYWSYFVPQQPFTDLVQLFPLTWLILVAWMAWLVAAWLRRFRPPSTIFDQKDSPGDDHRVGILLLVMLWFVVPAGVAWLTTQMDWARLFFRRYLMTVAVGPALVATLSGSLLRDRRLRLALLALLGLSALLGSSPFHWRTATWVWPRRGEDWRQAVATINAQTSQPSLPVVFRSGLIEATPQAVTARDVKLQQYLRYPISGPYQLQRKAAQVILLPSRFPGSGTALQPAELRQIQRAGGAWLLVRGGKGTFQRSVDRIALSLRQPGSRPQLSHQQSFGRLHVARLSLDRQLSTANQ